MYQYRCDLQRRVDRCLALQPTNPHGRRLQKRYTTIQDHLFLFLDDAAIPPHEQLQRASHSHEYGLPEGHQRVSLRVGTRPLAAVRSVVNTGKRQGLSAYQAIQKALSPIASLFEPG